jgi:GT2 family glycosyltransferase
MYREAGLAMNDKGGNVSTNRLSAVIVNYNAGEGLLELVRSLASVSCIQRVVVVDNASTDDSADLLAASFQGQPKLELIWNPVNRGFGAGNNQGVAGTKSEYLLFINPDVTIQGGMLDDLCRMMDSRPDVGMLGILIRNPDGSEQRGCRRYLPDPHRSLMHTLGEVGSNRSDSMAGFNLTDTPLPSGPAEVEAISGAFMLVRRQALLETGGWDEGYFLHCEDLDLCMRFKQSGWKVLFVPHESVIHMQGVSSRSRPVFVLWHKHRGMWRYFTKFHRLHNPWWLSVLVWTGIWARFLLLLPAALLRLASRDRKAIT